MCIWTTCTAQLGYIVGELIKSASQLIVYHSFSRGRHPYNCYKSYSGFRLVPNTSGPTLIIHLDFDWYRTPVVLVSYSVGAWISTGTERQWSLYLIRLVLGFRLVPNASGPCILFSWDFDGYRTPVVSYRSIHLDFDGYRMPVVSVSIGISIGTERQWS